MAEETNNSINGDNGNMNSNGLSKKIRKRDGRLVEFDTERVRDAIHKAFIAVKKEDGALAEKLAKEVVEIVHQRIRVPHVEQVQDVVEEVLMKEGLMDVAKAYIIYRAEHKKLRDATKLLLDSQQIIRNYISEEDWRVYENANIGYSFGGLLFHSAGTIMAYYGLNFLYPPEISEAHITGDFHIHNLSMSLAGYCAGWNLRQLILEGFGGVHGRIESGPAKHLRTVVGQMINFIGTLQNEWAGAQAFNSFDTYLAPFVRYDQLNYDQVKQCIQEFIFNMNVTSRWGGQCVSEDTEALTENGWKKYNEIKNEKIATFNINKKKIEYLKADKINIYDYDGYLLKLKNRTQEQLITLNHRIVRKKFNSGDFEIIEAEQLKNFKTPILIPLASETENTLEIPDDQIRLYAWLVSEGSFSEDRARVSIFQSEGNKETCSEIRDCLHGLELGWDETKRVHGFPVSFKFPTIRFRLNQASSRKVRQSIIFKEIPPIIKNLSKRQIRLFLDTYIKGDGHKEKKGRIRIYTKNPKVRDQIQELCVLCNYGSTINKNRNGVYIINIIRNPLASITKITKEKYKGKVWCPTTANGTFIARRNGKVFITGNSPFSNITIDLVVPEDLKDQQVLIGGKLQKETYSDFQDEMDLINKAFIEVMTTGDHKGRVFTWPIPTYNITKDFKWNSELSEMLFEMTAKYGLPYFQNFVNSDLKPSDIRAMCCRLQLNLKELSRNVTGGRFGSGDSTGSIGVVTMNLPRIGFLAKDEDDFFERLDQKMYLAMRSLEIKRKVVSNNLDKGLLPFTRRYLGNLDHHFSTIGLIGMNEACLNFLKQDIGTQEGQKFSLKVLEFMRGRLREYQEETGHIYNLEATPGEGTSYRLAKKDRQEFRKIIASGQHEPYYTNSTQLPVGYTEDILFSLKHQEPLQNLYTGGTVFHTFLGEALEPKQAKIFVSKTCSNFKLPYLTLTPTFSVCPSHGYLKGKQEACPTCSKRTEVYSRVVGYLRPVRNWNLGKQEEFKERKMFNISSLS